MQTFTTDRPHLKKMNKACTLIVKTLKPKGLPALLPGGHPVSGRVGVGQVCSSPQPSVLITTLRTHLHTTLIKGTVHDGLGNM